MMKKEKNKTLADLLRLKPNISKGFQPIDKWEKIKKTNVEKQAYEIFRRRENRPDHPDIKNNWSIPHIVSYLRYDFKRIIVRTRLLYIDNYIDEATGRLTSSDLIGLGFFEPLLICLSFAEALGYMRGYNKARSLGETLKWMGEGYAKYAKPLRQIFRNGLVHRFRPQGGFHINVNIKGEYLAPYIYNLNGEKVLKINVIHFLDSLVITLEKLIISFQTNNAKYVEDYLKGLNGFNQEAKQLVRLVQQSGDN